MPLTESDLIRIRQFIQKLEAGLLDGLSVFITYHDADLEAKPSNPTGDGTTGGWHTDSTEFVNWMSTKRARYVTEGTWGNPMAIRGLTGEPGDPGGDAVVYYIKPTDGTAIKNGTGTLTIEAHKITGGSDVLLSSGTIKLYDPSDNEITVANGYAAGSDGYTGVFDAGDISLSKVVTMKDGPSGSPLDTITLVDILDGEGIVVYYIKPTNGTAIKNGTGTLTLEAHKITGGSDVLLSSGTIKLYDPSNNLITVANGYAAGSDGYTGVFDAGDINLSKVITMKDGAGGTVLDTVTVIDVLDGDPGDPGDPGDDAIIGSVESNNGLAWVQAAGPGTWTPATMTTTLTVTYYQGGAEINTRTVVVTRSGATLSAPAPDTVDGITYTRIGNGTSALTILFDHVAGEIKVAETCYAVAGSNDAIVGCVESDIGLVWLQAPGPGDWTPAGTECTLTVRYYKSGAQINTRTVVITRSDSTLTAPAPDTVDGITYSRIGSGTSAITIIFEHVASDIKVSETVYAIAGSTSSGGGLSDDVPLLRNITFIGSVGSGKVGWTSGYLDYGGSTYNITTKAVDDGSTDAYIYWDADDQNTTFKTTASLATAITAGNWVVCKNVSGVAIPAAVHRILLGGLIQASTLAAINANLGTVTAGDVSACTLNVQTADIENLAVETIKIKDGAVSVLYSAYTAGAKVGGGDVQSVANVAVATGQKVVLTASLVTTNTGGSDDMVTHKLKRGAVEIYTTGEIKRPSTAGVSGLFDTINYIDQPPPGAYTYYLNTDETLDTTRRFLSAIVMKK